jgi:hypothetical protein
MMSTNPAALACCPRAATCMNEVSSRSHCIVTVTVEKALPDGTVQQGKLCMVDLAGRWGGVGQGRSRRRLLHAWRRPQRA